jgi:hypothetical protein
MNLHLSRALMGSLTKPLMGPTMAIGAIQGPLNGIQEQGAFEGLQRPLGRPLEGPLQSIGGEGPLQGPFTGLCKALKGKGLYKGL